MEETAITHFVDQLKHQPENVSGSLYRKPGSGGAFQWLTLSYRLMSCKMKDIGPWLIEIRKELEERGVSVRNIKTDIYFLNIEPEKNPACNCHADFKVIATQALQEHFDAFKAAAKELGERMRETP